MEKNTANLSGALLINKPAGVTSHDIVNDIRHIPELKGVKVGHSGTLDPFATGLLIILLGHATRLQDELHILKKTYRAEITLGATSDTDDGTGTLTTTGNTHTPLEQEIQRALQKITSVTEQTPPAYAAIKIGGRKLYEYARAGESVETKPRPVTIYEIFLEQYEYQTLKITVTCSTGTYIRSIARDIGKILGTGAYCSVLTRTAIGPFEVKKAVEPERVQNIQNTLIPMEQLTSHLPQLICEEGSVVQYKQGKTGECEEEIPTNTPIALLDENQKLFGIGIRGDGKYVRPKKIFL
jgi:tRNA pseudouridine55 synthase